MSCRLTGLVAGLDEAGRAPLAGPVVSSCVVWEGLPRIREKVNDSKLLTEKERDYLLRLDPGKRIQGDDRDGDPRGDRTAQYPPRHSPVHGEGGARYALAPTSSLWTGSFPLKSVANRSRSSKATASAFSCLRLDRGKGRERPAHGRLRRRLSAVHMEEEQGISDGGAQVGHRDLRDFPPPQEDLQGRQGVLTGEQPGRRPRGEKKRP